MALRISTVAAATTDPDGSVTVPVTVPLVICPRTWKAPPAKNTRIATTLASVLMASLSRAECWKPALKLVGGLQLAMSGLELGPSGHGAHHCSILRTLCACRLLTVSCCWLLSVSNQRWLLSALILRTWLTFTMALR